MIHSREEIRGVKTGRHYSGSEELPFITDRVQPAVYGCDCCRRDSDNCRIVAPRLLEVGEKEGAVPFDWTTEGSAVLRLGKQVFGGREGIASVEALIAREAVKIAAPVIRSRFSDNVDDAT